MDYIYKDILDALNTTDDTDSIADYVNKIEAAVAKLSMIGSTM